MIRTLAIIVALAQIALQTLGAQAPFSIRVVASGLGAPWEVVWGPDDQLWITERTGRRVIRMNPATGAVTPALSVDESYDPRESWHEGVLGLALHPDLLKKAGRDYVYVAYTYDADPGPALLRKLKVRRYTYDPAKSSLVSPVDLITNVPAHDDHGGGRLAFGPDQKLYLTRGDNGGNWLANYCMPNRSQDLPTAAEIAARDWSTYVGKILRIDLDGSIPADNPTINGVRSHIYTYGHRNPQGLAFGPTGLLYSSEHGPNTDDELNLITAGGNYGWPHIAGYRDDRGYVYSNWSQSKGVPCASLKFDESAPVPAIGAAPARERVDQHLRAADQNLLYRACRPRLPEVRRCDHRRGRTRDLYGARERHSGLGEFRAAAGHDDGPGVPCEVERRRPLRGGRERGALPNGKSLS